jgi:hypothetical protein
MDRRVEGIMDPQARERLVAAWIAGEAAGPGSDTFQENWWAIERLTSLPVGNHEKWLSRTFGEAEALAARHPRI